MKNKQKITYRNLSPSYLQHWDDVLGGAYDAPSIEQDSDDDCRYLLDPKGLSARGLVAYEGALPIGHAVLIPIRRELQYLESKELPDYFAKCAKRANWTERIVAIARQIPLSRESYHLYDLAIRPEFRGQGIGPKLLAQTLETHLEECDIKIGFIEEDNTPSLQSTLRAGHIIVEKTPTSYDGEHPSFVSIFGKHISPALEIAPANGTTQEKLEHILESGTSAALNSAGELCYARFPK